MGREVATGLLGLVQHRSTAAIEVGVTHMRGCERVAPLLELHSPVRHTVHERRGPDEHVVDTELDQASGDTAVRRKGGDRLVTYVLLPLTLLIDGLKASIATRLSQPRRSSSGLARCWIR